MHDLPIQTAINLAQSDQELLDLLRNVLRSVSVSELALSRLSGAPARNTIRKIKAGEASSLSSALIFLRLLGYTAIVAPAQEKTASPLWVSRMGTWLQTQRLDHGWSQRGAARQAKIPINRSREIGMMERGDRWYWTMFYQLLAAYGYTLFPVPLPPGKKPGLVQPTKTRLAIPRPSRRIVPLAEDRDAHIRQALRHCHGDYTKTAKLLGVDPSTIYRHMSKDR